MKRGFTLLELIVVIIIIGILATLGLTQYSRMIERARGAEARQIMGALRTNAAAIYMQNSNTCTPASDSGVACDNTNLGIGSMTAGAEYPGGSAGNCAASHYFWYNVAASATGITATATRCTTGGKNPPATVAGTISLTSNFQAGTDQWATSGQY